MESQQIATKFISTAEMVVFAEAYVKSQGNITKAFEDMGRGRDIYYKNWRYQEGFDEWLSDYAKKEVLKRVGKWYLIAEKYAEAGSYQHLNLLMQIKKEFAPEPLIDLSQSFVHIYRPEAQPKEEVEKEAIPFNRIEGK